MISLSSYRKYRQRLAIPGDALPAPAVPAFRSGNDDFQAGINFYTVAPPAGTVAGDFILGWIGSGNGGTTGMNSTGGQTWTEITQLHQAALGTDQLRVWWAINNGSMTSVQFGATNVANAAGGLAAFTGVNVTTPLDCVPVLAPGFSSSSTTVPDITTVTNNALRIVTGWVFGAITGYPSGFNNDMTAFYSGIYTDYLGDKLAPVAGVVGGETLTHPSNLSRTIAHLALRPA